MPEPSAARGWALPPAELRDFQKLESSAKKLEAALKSPKIHKPSQVWEAMKDADTAEVLMVIYESGIRVVQDRIRAYYQKYLGQAQEITEEQVVATGVKPGTPKFDKALKTMVAAHLNARPRKVPPPEPEVVPAPPMINGRPGRKPAQLNA